MRCELAWTLWLVACLVSCDGAGGSSDGTLTPGPTGEPIDRSQGGATRSDDLSTSVSDGLETASEGYPAASTRELPPVAEETTLLGARVRRLSSREYVETVRALLGSTGEGLGGCWTTFARTGIPEMKRR
jgi:hypothetical protein